MKKNLFVLLMPLLLTSCDFILTPSTSSSETSDSESSSSENSVSSESSSSLQTTSSSVSQSASNGIESQDEVIHLENKNSQYDQESWTQEPTLAENTEKRASYTIQTNDVRISSDYLYDPSSLGDVNILVIPVTFKGFSYLKTEEKREEVRQDLAYTFFGAAEDTGWESVSSFYYKSSYGKLNISGNVAPWFTLDKTPSQLEKLSGYSDPTYYVLRQAVQWYQNNFDDIADFDKDGDHVIDAVWLVYDAPNSYTSSDVWWAYTFWDYENTKVGNTDSYYAYTYAWASYDFMYEGKYRKGTKNLGDAHTYIHETGHVLGLDDYYSYDSSPSVAPAGQLDMMDGNIGDHDAYSKFVLGWVDPIYVTNSTEITLRPFESTGDCVLLASSWNGSAYDEYLMIEFYTPTGLNQQDATVAYPSRSKLFTTSGIKIYHVDSRIATFDARGYFQSYTDKIITNSNYYTGLAHSNTPSRSVDSDYSLLHLLDASGSNRFMQTATAAATNNTLFKVGSTFNPKGTHATFFQSSNKFNSGKAINYTIKVSSITNTSCKIVISKIA